MRHFHLPHRPVVFLGVMESGEARAPMAASSKPLWLQAGRGPSGVGIAAAVEQRAPGERVAGLRGFHLADHLRGRESVEDWHLVGRWRWIYAWEFTYLYVHEDHVWAAIRKLLERYFA